MTLNGSECLKLQIESRLLRILLVIVNRTRVLWDWFVYSK